MPCCKVEEYGGWCKDLPVVDYWSEPGKEYCIFHSPLKRIKDESGKAPGYRVIETSGFNNLVYERINNAKAKNELCNLGGTVFKGDISFRQFDKDNPLPEIDFSSATFTGEAHFSLVEFSEGAVFENTEFSKKANFIETKFSSKAYFLQTVFIGEAIFFSAKFIGEAYFLGAKFNGSASFFATFNEKADFSHAAFRGKAYFSGAKFIGEANFFNAEFIGEVDFIETTFSGEANFSKAFFKGKAIFSDSKVKEKTFFKGKAFFVNIAIEKKLEFEKIRLDETSFINTNLRKIDFINCDWPKMYCRDVLCDELELFKAPKNKNFKHKIKEVEILYQKLKEKSKDDGNWPEVSNWHYGEKEMYRKATRCRRRFPLSLPNLYWAFSGYCERPLKAGIWFVILFALAFFALAFFGMKSASTFYEGFYDKGYISISQDAGAMDKNSEDEIHLSNLTVPKAEALITYVAESLLFRKDIAFIPANTHGKLTRVLFQIFFYIQSALFILSLRNKFRR